MSAHDDFVGGLVSALIAEPRRRLTPRVARAAVDCLVALSALLPYAHTQLLRLLHSQWRVLHSVPAVDVSDGKDLSALDTGLQRASSVDAGADGDTALTLLQAAARAAQASGANDGTEEGAAAVQRAYAKLAKSVPALLGK